MSVLQKNIEQLLDFRKRFGGVISKSDIKAIFGEDISDEKFSNISMSEASLRKVKIAESYVKYFTFLDWVKFIAVSGSVGAGTAKDGDDIDLFIVVKNSRMWIYRGVLAINPFLWQSLRREWRKGVENRFCINLIAEERGLKFDSDIFTFHELYFMKPIYNAGYKLKVIYNNPWVKAYGGVTGNSEQDIYTGSQNLLLRILDWLAFISQYMFMKIFNHNPNYSRLMENNRKGRIEFFPVEFKKEVLSKL